MKKLLLVVFAFTTLLPFIGNSQSYTFLNSFNHQRTIFTCDGYLMDEGYDNLNYKDSNDYWTAFCPSYSNKRIKINFSEFDIHPSDRVEIYYGVGINGIAYIENPQQPYFTNQELLGKEIIVPLTDTTGCLTVRIVSDDSLNAQGFKARLSCIQHCQIPVADLDTFFIKYNAAGQATIVPVRDIIDTTFNLFDNTFTTNHYKTLNFCDGDSIVFVAKPLFPENNSPYPQGISSCIFDWNFGDGTVQTVYGSNMVGHKFTKNVLNFVSLKVTDANQTCESTNELKIRAIMSKISIKSMLDSLDICSGTPFNYLVGYENNNNLILSSNFNKAYSYDSTSLIPDGPNCTFSCTEAKITVDNYPSGTLIRNTSDILSVCMNIEHSFAGDLSIELVCPNGSSTILKHFTFSGGAHLGEAFDQSNGCDPNNPQNAPGIGWNYCFSNQLLNGQRGVLTGNTVSPIDSSHMYLTQTGYFQTPNQSAT
ncbi:MAG: proprotein convertase P-domain-containing protein, partial [Bacteroidales bacterium]|nr:proprotein convertase P-domain-containing protein [Bacteroidales bacterium]